MIVAYRIACEYTYLNNPDSCFRYFKEAINVAQTNGYDREYDIVRNYADAYNYFDKSDKAIEILRELDKKYPQKLKAYFSYTNAWLNLNQLDSAKVYLDYMGKNLIPPPTANDYFVVSFIVNSLQSAYNAKTGKPSEILGIARIADNSMHHLRNNISVDKERVFLQNKLERDKSNLKIEKQQQLQTYLIIIIAILLITAIIIFVYQRKILKKERLIQLAKERLQENTVKLYENENTIKENENIIKDLTSQLEENSDIKEQLEEIEQIKEANKSLLKQNGLLSKEIDKYTTILTKKESEKAFEEVSRQNIVLQEREKFLLDQLISNHDILSQLKYSPKYITDEQWATIVNIINVLYNNYTVRLQADFPNLTEDDIRYSCLIKLRLSTSTIATLMAVSPPSVTKRKQRIKERMNKQNSGTLFKELSLENYLWSY